MGRIQRQPVPPGWCCLIERWDFDPAGRAFVHTGTATVQPDAG